MCGNIFTIMQKTDNLMTEIPLTPICQLAGGFKAFNLFCIHVQHLIISLQKYPQIASFQKVNGE